MKYEKILSINVQELRQNNRYSAFFSDLYNKLAMLQSRVRKQDELHPKERNNLPSEYKSFRDEVALRMKNCRQVAYKHSKYEAWYKEIKSFYDRLPVALE